MFSFEGYRQLKPRVPWTLIGVLLVVGSVELTMGWLWGSVPVASALEWYESPKSLAARVRFLEREVVAGDPQAIILGSSRAAMGIEPRSFEAALGLAEGSSWNLGLIGGGRPFDTRHVAEKFLPRATKLDWVVVAIDEFTFSRAHAHGELFREHAPLTARWSEAESRWSASLDGLSLLRRRAPQIVETLRAYEAGERDLDLWVTPDRQVRFRSWGNHREAVTAEGARRIADRYFRDYALNGAAEGHFRAIAERVRAAGARCVFVTLPSHPTFRRTVATTYGAELDEMMATLTLVCQRSGSPFLRFDTEPYPPELFRDAVHLTAEGAREFSADLGEALRAL